MSRIYNNKHKIKFTSISMNYRCNNAHRSTINKIHARIITYVCNHFKDTKKYKEQVVYALNLVTYFSYSGDYVPNNWSCDDPFVNIPNVDTYEIEECIGDVFLTVDGIEWDISPCGDIVDIGSISSDIKSCESNNMKDSEQESSVEILTHAPIKTESVDDNVDRKLDLKNKMSISSNSTVAIDRGSVIQPTPKQDLYIQPPVIPQFDYSKPWMKCKDGADNLVIYTTRPEIPKKQNQISATTDVTKMTYKELMNLYPNHIIHTRASIMYEPLKDVVLDPDLGLILPITGFTEEQVRDNIIRYPHIFKLIRKIDNEFYSFYSHIEIDGKLFGTLDVWDTLPESYVLPRQAEFVKEYVVRRYLLERDICHVEHNYPIYGTLDEFLTLFMTPDDYIRLGYTDTEKIVKQCVQSRVSYKQSRNPIIRRVMNNA